MGSKYNFGNTTITNCSFGGNSQLTINGKTYHGNNITIRNNKVYIDGKLAEDTSEQQTVNISVTLAEFAKEVKLEGVSGDVTLFGNVESLETDGSAQVHGSVGTVNSSGSTQVNGNVTGSVRSGGSTNVGGDVRGGIRSGGSTNVTGDYVM